MRIIRVKPSQKVKEYLTVLAKRYGIKDTGLVADIFGILRFQGRGLPTEERLDKLAETVAQKMNKPEVLIGLLLKKRLIALKNVIATPLFAGLVKGNYDLMDGVEKILETFTELHTKKQAYQCKGCKFNEVCKFAQQYSNLVTDISKVRDTDYKKLVHPDCPAMPELDFVNSIEESRKFFDNLMEEESAPEAEVLKDSVDNETKKKINYMQGNEMQQAVGEMQNAMGGGGACDDESESDTLDMGDDLDSLEDYQEFADMNAGGYTHGNKASVYRFDGRYCVSVSQKLVKEISDEEFAFFDIARKLDFLMDKHKKGKFKPTEELGKDKGQENVKKLSDVPKVLPSEHQHDDETFLTKLSRKNLAKRQERNPQKRKALMYVLVDCSGSMYTGVTSRLAFLSRFNTARIFTLALARRLMKEDGIMYWRAFSDYPGSRVMLDGKSSYADFGRKMANMNLIGGGTRIERCLKTAMDDIHEAKDQLSKAEILVITDCEDRLDKKALENQLKRWPTNILHTLDVSGKGLAGSGYGNASKVLKEISNEYYYVDPSAGLDLENIVKTVI